VQGILAVSGGESVSKKNHNGGIVLEEPEALEDLLNVNGDPGPEPTLPPHVATFLGEQLQTYYTQLMSEPVPDRFVQLLKQLDGKERDHDGE
jgi:Anti-sigma factor NepR